MPATTVTAWGHNVMLSIGFVAANLGVSTSTLRKWEERYGHPKPIRSEGGSRWYRDVDLEALRKAKRMLDRGIRAHRVFTDFDRLLAEAEQTPNRVLSAEHSATDPSVAQLLECVHDNRLEELKARLKQIQDVAGPQAFIEHTAVPMMRAVGDGWAAGQIDVYQEHAVAEVLGTVLNGHPADEAGPNAPTVVLTTPAGEQHDIALNMVSASLSRCGARCINLGASLPLPNLLSAASAFRADIVGISISSVNAGRLARRFVAELRTGLPRHIDVWVGGSGAALMPALPEGVRAFRDTLEPSVLIHELIAEKSRRGVSDRP